MALWETTAALRAAVDLAQIAEARPIGKQCDEAGHAPVRLRRGILWCRRCGALQLGSHDWIVPSRARS